MESMNLEQLRAAVSAGGVTGVTLKGQGSGFFVEITTRTGQGVVLSKARSATPRRFGNPASALVVLRNIGIAIAQVDATNWDPKQKELRYRRPSRAEAMRAAHQAAAYNKWLADEIRASIDDPRPSIPHAEAMDAMDAEIAAVLPARGQETHKTHQT